MKNKSLEILLFSILLLLSAFFTFEAKNDIKYTTGLLLLVSILGLALINKKENSFKTLLQTIAICGVLFYFAALVFSALFSFKGN